MRYTKRSIVRALVKSFRCEIAVYGRFPVVELRATAGVPEGGDDGVLQASLEAANADVVGRYVGGAFKYFDLFPY